MYTAADGNAGLKSARAFKPDLIILDLMLPGMDGIELLSILRRESDVYVIMLTARTDETDTYLKGQHLSHPARAFVDMLEKMATQGPRAGGMQKVMAEYFAQWQGAKL